MSTWLAIIGVGAVTFLMRASFIVFADPQRFPAHFRRALGFVPPARDGKRHDVSVRVLPQDGMKARARKDYVAPKD